MGRVISESMVWQPEDREHLQYLPLALREMFFYAGSMTEHLRSVSQRFSVKVIKNEVEQILQEENDLLHISSQERGLVREVILQCDDEPWMFARSIFLDKVLSGAGKHLSELGDNPLGDVLFKDPTITRSDFEFTQIAAGNELYQKSIELVESSPDVLWARRSLFYFGGPADAILLYEVFLPNFRA